MPFRSSRRRSSPRASQPVFFHRTRPAPARGRTRGRSRAGRAPRHALPSRRQRPQRCRAEAIVSTICGGPPGCAAGRTGSEASRRSLAPPSTRSTVISQPASCRMAFIRSGGHLEGDGLGTARGNVGACRPTRHADDAAARVHIPVRRAETGEGGHEIDTSRVRHALGKKVALMRVPISPSSSRSHWMALPALNTLPLKRVDRFFRRGSTPPRSTRPARSIWRPPTFISA